MFKNVGIQLYSIRNHTQDLEGIKHALKSLAEIGYTELQTAGAFPCSVEEYMSVVKENGLKIIGTHYILPENLDDLDDYIAYHKALETTNAGVGGGASGKNKEDLMAYIDHVNALAEKLAEHGMKFTYHHHSHEFGKVDTLRTMDYLVDGFDKKNVSFVLDTYWLSHAGCDVNEWIKKLEGRVDILHLKDKEIPFGTNDGIITEVGSGNLNFESIIKTAEATGVKHICVEQDDWPSDRDSLECAKMSFDHIAKIIGL